MASVKVYMKTVLHYVEVDRPQDREEGTWFGQGVCKVDYGHLVCTPSFWFKDENGSVNGNAVFSHCLLQNIKHQPIQQSD